MDAETGFLIDGKVYEVPMLDSLNIDEAAVLYDYCGIVQEDFAPEPGETEDETDARNLKLARHPGFWNALMLIAYQRGNPTVKPAFAKAMIGKTNRLEALSTMVGAEPEADEIPLVLTSEPSDPSSNGLLENEPSTPDSSVSGGSVSTNGSAGQAGPLVSTGTTRSGMYSTSAPENSAA